MIVYRCEVCGAELRGDEIPNEPWLRLPDGRRAYSHYRKHSFRPGEVCTGTLAPIEKVTA